MLGVAVAAALAVAPHATAAEKELHDRIRAVRKLDRQYRTMFQAAHKAVRIDPNQLGRVVGRHLRPLGPVKLSIGELAVIIGVFPPEEETPPEPTAVCLDPPYDSGGTHTSIVALVLTNEAEANEDPGSTETSGYSHFGGLGTNSAVVGSYVVTRTFTIPDNGAEYLVRAGTSSWFFGAGNGGATATIDGHIKEICVEVHN